MRIVHVYRQARPGAYSIEALFRTVSGELEKQGETVVPYELGPRIRLFKDVLALRKLKADCYHVTGDVNYLVFFLPRRKTVLTVHDIGHYLFGLRGWRQAIFKWVWLALPMQLARRVTAVSAATRVDIVKHVGVPARRILIINNCYDPIFQPNQKKFNSSCPRILQVGTKPYKNVPRLIRALQGISCELVLIGELDSQITSALAETGLAYENWNGISQDALLQQYVEADLVAFVSTGEGFGMPIIEAQAMGKPLITANKPPMSLAAGVGACLADPLDVEGIRRNLLRLICDEAFRQQVVADGLKNVARYSPETIGQAYLQVYFELVES